MVKLDKLIKKAKEGKVFWRTRVKMKETFTMTKPFKNLSLNNWENIIHVYPFWWDGEDSLINQIAQSDKLIRKSDQKFVSKEILVEFKKYVNSDQTLKTSNRGIIKISDINENDVIKTSWKDIAIIIKESQKIFKRDGDRNAYQS